MHHVTNSKHKDKNNSNSLNKISSYEIVLFNGISVLQWAQKQSRQASQTGPQFKPWLNKPRFISQPNYCY